MIIGLTGSLAAGKGIVSDFLKKQGFVYLSLSNEVRALVAEAKIEVTRKNLQDFANKKREENGNDYFAKIVVEKIQNQKYNKAVVDGIRNPAEVLELRKLKNFFLISVDAPAEVRFKRMVERARESDPVSWEDFLKVDARDKGEGEAESGQGVGKCMQQADLTLINDGGLEEVQRKVDELYRQILLKLPRPSWDEYFVKMAALVAERATCLRHHVGAVIVKDKRVITTGYNGAARGMTNCLDLGCMKDKLGITSGLGFETCRALHAEQNAIIQGAFHGTSVKDATMYCTHSPCMACAKILVNAGIKEVVTYFDYGGDRGAKEYLERAGIIVRKINRPEPFIDFKD